LAYKKFLETKQAQQDFKRLKEMLKTASYEEKVEIEKKLIEVNKIRAEEAERKKKMASIQAKMPENYVKPVTKINVKEKGVHGEGGGRSRNLKRGVQRNLLQGNHFLKAICIGNFLKKGAPWTPLDLSLGRRERRWGQWEYNKG
jgi:hypothetical protein